MNKPRERIFLSPPHMSGDERWLVYEAFESNYIAPLGPMVQAFEQEFSAKVGVPHAVALSSGTAALHLAVRLLGVGPGDEVIAPSLTFIGGVSPITFQGGTPVFIDSDRISWNMDPDLLGEEIDRCRKRGKMPRAVVTADIYGLSTDMDRVHAICDPHGIPVVSDSAEALGSTYKGRVSGVGAWMAVYSFNGNKIITTSGGGMLGVEDRALAEKARFLAQQARDAAAHYQHTQIGHNYRMSNILAAIGRGQLRVLDERVAARRRIFDCYRWFLGGVPGIEFMPESLHGECNRWLTVILVDPEEFGADREAIRHALEAENIESRPVWKPMHMQPVFSECRMMGGAVSRDLFERGLCLPSGSAMTDADLERVAGIVAGVAGHRVALSDDRPRAMAQGAAPHQDRPLESLSYFGPDRRVAEPWYVGRRSSMLQPGEMGTDLFSLAGYKIDPRSGARPKSSAGGRS